MELICKRDLPTKFSSPSYQIRVLKMVLKAIIVDFKNSYLKLVLPKTVNMIILMVSKR